MLNAKWLSRPGAVTRPVLFLHGFMGSLGDWNAVSAGLGVDTIGLDLPGHGFSADAPGEFFTLEGVAHAITQTLDRLGVGSIDLVGYSMGGRIALAFVRAYPDRVSKLILESTHPGIEGQEERRARLALDLDRASRLQQNFEGFLTEWFEQPLFNSLSQRPELLLALRQQRITQPPDALARALVGFSPGQSAVPDVFSGVSRSSITTPQRPINPHACICGALDEKYLEIGRRWAERPGGPRLHVVPGAGHNVHLEAPDAYLAALTSILEPT